MIYKDFVRKHKEFLKKHPEAGEMQVVCAKDEEGNGFWATDYGPTPGIFEDGDFTEVDEIEMNEEGAANAVCIN